MRRSPLFEARLASHFAPLLKSEAKFRAFLSCFRPLPPVKRPSQFVRCDFADEIFAKDIGTIYGYRSKHLHDGISFPGPMCDAPRYWDQPDIEEKAFSEKPMNGGANYAGASWGAGTCPMLLCHFEYLTRGAILNWWKSRDQVIGFDLDGRTAVQAPRYQSAEVKQPANCGTWRGHSWQLAKRGRAPAPLVRRGSEQFREGPLSGVNRKAGVNQPRLPTENPVREQLGAPAA